MTDNANAEQKVLANLDRQRSTLADRIRLPVWYRAGRAVVILLLLSGLALEPLGAPPEVLVVMVVLTGVWLAVEWTVLRRTSGVRLAQAPFRAYPSARVPTLAALVVLVGGLVAATRLPVAGHWQLAVFLAAVVALLDLWLGKLSLDRIRSDIRSGRAKS